MGPEARVGNSAVSLVRSRVSEVLVMAPELGGTHGDPPWLVEVSGHSTPSNEGASLGAWKGVSGR